MVPEHVQCSRIGRHCVVVEVAADDVPQPLPLFGDWLLHAPPHLRFDHLELCLHAVPPGFPFDLEFALPSLAANEGEAQEVEGLRLAEPAPQRRRSAAKRPNSMSRVFSGCSVSANFCNRSRISSRKWRASLSCWKPMIKSSA